jgi:hypothetical protein
VANNKGIPKVKSSSTTGSIPSANVLSKAESQGTSGSTKIARPRDTTSPSFGGGNTIGNLRFGSPSSSATSTSQSGSQWSNLLKQTASGGIASALGGGLKDFLGIGAIVSGFVGLFGGGKSTPPPLTRFETPVSRNQTFYTGASANPGVRTDGGLGHDGAASGVYTSSHAPSSGGLQYQSTQIAQAVKQALLNSSSLNDVIAEI